jgi:CheY-like chemotaxis protein
VKVLVVDDHAAQRTALGAILADLDVVVVQASSGRDALRCLLQQEFAVILLDVNMPVMDGFETAALIRERRSSQHTPIIFITAYSDDAYAARGYSLGAVDYILSPVQADVLRTKVSVFIDLYRKAEQIERQREALWRYAAQLQQLSEASLAINSAPSIEGVLEVVAESAGRIIGAHQSGASALLDNGTIATTTRVSEQHGGDRATRTSRNPGSVLGLAAQRPQRLCQADLEASSLWQGRVARNRSRLPMRGWLAAPLSTRDGHTVGIVQLSDKSAGEFSNEDEGIVVQLAQMASIAIENSKASDAREANRLKDEFLGRAVA